MFFSGRRHGVVAALGAGLVLAAVGAGVTTSGPPAPPAGAAPVVDQRAATATERPARPTKPTFPSDGRRAFAPARVLVEPRAGVGAARVGEVAGRVGARVDRVLPGSRTRVLRLPQGVAVAEAVRRLEASGAVRYAEPDFLLQPSSGPVSTPNDPDYPRLWGLSNSGQTGGRAGADIDAPTAWRVTTGSSAGAPVAVIDTGVDVTHPDLRDNVWVNPGEVAANGVDDDRNGYVDDLHGWDFHHDDATVFDGVEDDHGTHVAGTIAGTGGNGTGVTGVSWRATLMPVKFLGPGGGYTSDAIAALDYAVANGARLSNNSWGGAGQSQALREAITRAEQAGHVLVAAAGNGGPDGVGDDNDAAPQYPASYPQDNVITVAASTDTDALASFSNFGATSVDLAAPGTGILSTLSRGAYGVYDGTSMATPHVTGAAALLLAAEPRLSADALRDRLLGSVDPVASLYGRTVTGGRLDVGRAVAPTVAPPAAAPVDVADPDPALTLAADPAVLTYPAATSLSGQLSAAGSVLPDQRVELQQRPVGSATWTTAALATTDEQGRYTFSGQRVVGHTDHRVVYAGADGVAAAGASPARRVSVRVAVSLGLDTRALSLGRARALAGQVRPAHGGAVQLTVSRNGVVVLRRTLRLAESRYAFTYRPTRVGSYSFTVRRSADSDHLAQVSPRRSLRVVR